MRAGGEPLLVTISHESDAHIVVTSDELDLIISQSPEFRMCLALSRAVAIAVRSSLDKKHPSADALSFWRRRTTTLSCRRKL